jgi:hypothetical protein
VERGDGRGGGRRKETAEDAFLEAEHGAGNVAATPAGGERADIRLGLSPRGEL